MNMFLIGVLVGVAAFALIYNIIVLNKIYNGMVAIHQTTDNIGKALNMAILKLSKVEKITQATMNSAETFVDALRESAEQMMMRPPHMKRPKFNDGEQFDDLRKAFDEGIRQMEENSEDSDDDEEESDEKWK